MQKSRNSMSDKACDFGQMPTYTLRVSSNCSDVLRVPTNNQSQAFGSFWRFNGIKTGRWDHF